MGWRAKGESGEYHRRSFTHALVNRLDPGLCAGRAQGQSLKLLKNTKSLIENRKRYKLEKLP
jgi:hypothetical protein